MTTNDSFLTALARALRTGPARQTIHQRALDIAAAAPPDAAPIARAVAEHASYVRFHFRAIDTKHADDFTGMFEVGGFGPSTPGWFDPTQGLMLGTSGGGEIAFGIAWPSGALELVEIDPDAGAVLRFTSPEAFFRHVLDDETTWAERRDMPIAAALAAIFADAGSPLPAPPPPPLPRIEPAPDRKDDPYAEARAHFGRGILVMQSAPTASGRLLLARRPKHGAHGAEMVVREPDGTTRPVAWDPAIDVLSAAVAPASERVLVCAGVPGPLVEIDLATDARRELAPSVRWRCGFVDAHHLAVHGMDTITVHRFAPSAPLGPALASVPAPGFNLFAGEGHVLACTRDFARRDIAVMRWDGTALSPTVIVPVAGTAPAPAFFDAAVRVEGGLLLAVCEGDGTRWFRLVS